MDYRMDLIFAVGAIAFSVIVLIRSRFVRAIVVESLTHPFRLSRIDRNGNVTVDHRSQS
jgi:hypothetical protein